MKTNRLKRKKGFLASDFIIALVIFSGLLALILISVGALAGDYDNQDITDDEFDDNFNRFEETTANVTEMYDAANEDEGLTLVGSFDALFSSTFSIISLIFTSLSSVGGQLAGFADFFAIPTEVTKVFFTLIIVVLTAIIIFKIASTVSRRDI